SDLRWRPRRGQPPDRARRAVHRAARARRRGGRVSRRAGDCRGRARPNGSRLADSMTALADVRSERRDFAGAETLYRRALAVGAAAGAALLGAPAIVRSQQPRRFLRPLVAGLNAKEGDPSYESISRIPKILREKYNVHLDIQVHPSSVLGTDIQQIESVQTGFIDIASNVTAQWASFSDAFTFVDLPYAITSWEMFLRLAKSDLWRQQAAKFEAKTPLKVLPPVGSGGYRLLWNRARPTATPAAVKGDKYRT